MGMSGTAYRRTQEAVAASFEAGDVWQGKSLPVSQWSGQGLRSAQWDPGVATLASLVEEANQLLTRLSSAEIAYSSEGGMVMTTASLPGKIFPEEQLWGLLQRVRALHDTLVSVQQGTAK
ncbi:MAG: hypothetical protein HQM04_08540 [Magnetococcales bacterium]|nr:hypothetical protein [Magnetococcales bacterium]MBF0115079.1 hypothetical protein [Magnetococcales bacterium]